MSWTCRNAMSYIGRGQEGDARPGRSTHHDRAGDREGLSPTFRWHADVGEAESRVIAGDGGWCSEEQRDCGADKWRAHRRESNLPRG